MKIKTVFFVSIGILSIWFLYLEREILTPFVLAAIFAYIFNPVVNFLSHKIKIPRSISVVIVYICLMSLVIFSGISVTNRIFDESSELKNFVTNTTKTAKTQIATFPDWMRPVANDILLSLQASKIFSPIAILSFFPKAISRIVSFLIFVFAGFYFLKEGRNFFDKLLLLVPNNARIDVDILIRKINAAFKSYLRGQIFLIFAVSVVLYLCLSVIGLRFALIVAIFSGFAEIVPIVGPITAAIVAIIVMLTTGIANFGLTSFVAALIIGITYFVVRHLEDYFIIPYVMGRATKLHPFIIFFAVIAGGHLWGILGLILAVPIAAIIKILLGFFLDKLNTK